MRFGILTFAFAHNYGALLQATALKDYIVKMGNECKIIPYAPDQISGIYAINPFIPFTSVRSSISRLLKIRRRIKSYFRFKDYISYLCDGHKMINDQEHLSEYLKSLDAIIFGSDQIWNTNIIHEDASYFMPSGLWRGEKIAYAPSFGCKILNSTQIYAIKNYLNDFLELSLREEDGADDIESILDKRPKIVLDPVFLQGREYWENRSKRPRIKNIKEYILFYSLSFDLELVKKAEMLSKKFGIPIVSIHPTGLCRKMDAVFLDGVGPEEFLWLVDNASYIVTDSFHATAFSIIFEKKYFHKIMKDKETRIESLLYRIDAYRYCLTNEQILDFAFLDKTKLNDEIISSNDYLKNALNKAANINMSHAKTI